MGIAISCCLFFIILYHHSSLSKAEDDENGAIDGGESGHNQFKPGIAALVAILTIFFSILFLLLLYFRHCRRRTYASYNSRDHHQMEAAAVAAGRGRRSGVDRKVIQSLPMFRFSSLRGQKEDLECAVCLSRFEADEVLRLLPKCKHGFHVECIDTWLEGRSTCPLCRYRVDPEDLFLFDSNIPRISGDQGKDVSRRRSSSAEERGRSSSLEIIVENPGQENGRASADSSNAARRQKKWMRQELRSWSLQESLKPSRWNTGRKDGELPVQGGGHRLEHRIVVSGREEEEEELERRRWSDAEAAEILYLKTEMILERHGEEEEETEGKNVIKGRSVSEMTGVSRYRMSRNMRGDNGVEKERQEKAGAVNRWLSWISQSHQNTNTAPATIPAVSTNTPV